MSDSSIPDSVTNPDGKVQGLFTLTIRQWNAVIDVLSAEELSSQPNTSALEARNKIREYLRLNGYRRTDLA